VCKDVHLEHFNSRPDNIHVHNLAKGISFIPSWLVMKERDRLEAFKGTAEKIEAQLEGLR
jgi:hypothetical protein